MHSVEEMGSSVPAFLAKLWKLVEDPDTNDLICWSQNGASFYIRNQAQFARELLPLYYKHNNMASFIRQLNMYGFRKVVSIEGGGLRNEKDEMEFAHQYFYKDHPYLLEHIKRKIPTSKMELDSQSPKPELMTKVLTEVKNMKGRQDSVDTQLSKIQRENEVLWREVALLRQKHQKQQTIVNKLIQFLVTTMVHNQSTGLGLKRHYPLMINDSSHLSQKVQKLNVDLSKMSSELADNPSPKGPVIHELLEDCVPNIDEVTEDNSSVFPDNLYDAVDGQVQSPSSSSSSSLGTVPVRKDTIDSGQPSPEVLLELVEDCNLQQEDFPSRSTLADDPAIIANPELIDSIIIEPEFIVDSEILCPEDISQLPVSSKSGNDKQGKKTGNKKETDMKRKKRRRSSSDKTYQPKTAKRKMSSREVTRVNDLSVQTNSPLISNVAHKTNANLDDSIVRLDAATNEAISAIANVASEATKEVSDLSPPYILPIDPSEIESQIGDSDVLLSAVDSEIPVTDMTVSLPRNNNDLPSVSRHMLDNHIGSVQSELDNLKIILQGNTYSVDPNALLQIFNEEPLTYDALVQAENGNSEQTDAQGNELVSYPNNLFDLEDMLVDEDIGKWESTVSPSSASNSEFILSDLNTPQILNPNTMLSFPKKNK